MDTTTTIVVVLVVLAVLLLVAGLVWQRRRRSSLQDRFGPEYERTVAESDSRREAERDLQARTKRREELDIRPLEPARRDEYAEQWRLTQADFVDRPEQAVTAAQSLVTDVMRERGYPVGDPEQQMRDLSVDHAEVLDEYRAAHRISRLNDGNEATTEQLRQAMVHYRSLFGRLLDAGGEDERTDDPYPADTTDRRHQRH